MRIRCFRPLALALTLSPFANLVACSTDSGGGIDGGTPASEAGTADTGTGADTGTNHDATTADAGTAADASADSAPLGDSSAGQDATGVADAGVTDAGVADTGADAALATQTLVTTVAAGVTAVAVTINQGTAIGEGSGNGATPATLMNTAADTNNTQMVTSATNPFNSTGTVPDKAAGFCDYSGATPKRISYVTGAKFETTQTDPMVPMAPFYFPFVYTSTLTTGGNAFGGKAPILGLFDYRPKDLDEALVVAESDDNGQTWYFMQTLFELYPDLTNPISGGYSSTATSTGCPSAITKSNSKATSANGSTADDGWGHASLIQLPGTGNAATGQVLYLLDRNPNNMPGTSTPIVDNAPLHAIKLPVASNKFPIWNTNDTAAGANDAKSIVTALTNTAGATTPVVVKDTVGLLNPDGIMAVYPTATSAPAGTPVTVMYVQKIVGGDNTGSTALPASQQCNAAPFSGSTNHDISNVRLATTTDGITFTDLGIVQGLNDPTTVDYTQTRWVSPRGTLLDIKGDGSLWGLYFGGGNCLDGDSDAFHYIGYAESTDKVHWTVWNGINNPIASINTITTANQAGGATVTVPATAPVFPTEPFFAQRLYAPTATRIDDTHLSLTFAGYAVQSAGTDLLAYRQVGNVTLTVSQALPAGTPNNSNAH